MSKVEYEGFVTMKLIKEGTIDESVPIFSYAFETKLINAKTRASLSNPIRSDRRNTGLSSGEITTTFQKRSCNGLVCLRVTGGHAFNWKVSCFLICNPSTQTFKFKPNFPFLELKHLKIWELSYGFGYDGKHDDYKIIVTRKIWEDSVRVLYIYSFKDDLWKCVTLTHTAVEGSSRSYYQKLDSSAVFTNNMLHYIVYSPVDRDNKDPNYRIARFDLSMETWKDDLSFPVGLKLSTYVHLGVLDDCLYVRLVESYCCHNIWVMKGYRDGDYSWSFKYNIIGNLHDYALVATSKDGPLRLLFVDKYFDYSGIHHIMWYNPYDATTKSFRIQKWSSESSIHHCITSLVTIPGNSFNYRATRKQLK
ncbi:F-box protein CPR1-like [Silene latifolia]|uniref:F-box protein CPR1-like n=1 Tax=Silene latifolia TaxID=37657 RepID=UPI003D778FC2